MFGDSSNNQPLTSESKYPNILTAEEWKSKIETEFL